MGTVTTAVIVLTALLCTSSAASVYNLSITGNGTNNDTCLSGIIACLTLDYALNGIQFLRKDEPAKILIEVQYNHVVGKINARYQSNMDIEVFSGSSPVTLCFNRTDYFSGSSKLNLITTVPGYNVSFRFIRLGIHGCDEIGSREVAPVTLAFNVFTFLEFLHCSVVQGSSLELIIGDIQQVRITNCYFHHTTFSAGALSVHYVPYRDNRIEFIIQDNSFVNNTATGVAYASYFPILAQALAFDIPYLNYPLENVTVIIDNCTVTDNRKYSTSPIFRISAENTDKIRNGFFIIRNLNLHRLTGQADLIYFDLSSYIYNNYSNVKVDIIKCRFSDNYLFSSAALIAGLLQGQRNTQIGISNSLIYNNNGSSIYVRAYRSRGFVFNVSHTEFSGNSGDILIYLTCRGGIAIFDSVLFWSNSAGQLGKDVVYVSNPNFALVEVRQMDIRVINSNFSENYGTPLHLTNSNITFSRDVLFRLNFALNGGAIAFHESSKLTIEGNSTVMFRYNFADFGGAIYYNPGDEHDCLVDANNCSSASSTHFSGNEADIDGNVLFVTKQKPAECMHMHIQVCFSNLTLTSRTIGTPVSTIGFLNNSTAIFPGQNIPLGVTVLNYLNTTTTLSAKVVLHCDKQWFLCSDLGFELLGPHLTTLTTHELLPSDYGVMLPRENVTGHSLELYIHGFTQPNIAATLKLEIQHCPFGFTFNAKEGVCNCWNLDESIREHFYCSTRFGVACVARGYWLGQVENGTKVVALCQSPPCNPVAHPCPIRSLSSTFVELQRNVDDQCATSLGGILCTACRNETRYTFEAVTCIYSNICQPWQPYVLLVIAFAFQLVLCLILLGLLRLKLGFGSGYLYGPAFYLALTTQFPFGYYTSYTLLKIVTSVFTSVVFLDLEWFGYFPLCTFDIGTLGNFAFHYIGPLIVNLVLIITILVARKCPKMLPFLKDSPIQAICLLLFLSFWSLAETSVRVLVPVRLPGDGRSRVNLQPDILYMTGLHVFVAMVALLVLIFLVAPFILILLLSPFLARKVNLTKIKPILDEFQSCYKDKYRWYPAVYLVTWLLLLSSQSQPLAVQTELAILVVTHTLLQPYRNKWLNVVDTLLLMDSLFVYSILGQQRSQAITTTPTINTFATVLVYILVILPLLYIVSGLIYIVAQRINCSKYSSKSIQKLILLLKPNKMLEQEQASVTSTEISLPKSSSMSTDIELSILNGTVLREPLLDIIEK